MSKNWLSELRLISELVLSLTFCSDQLSVWVSTSRWSVTTCDSNRSFCLSVTVSSSSLLFGTFTVYLQIRGWCVLVHEHVPVSQSNWKRLTDGKGHKSKYENKTFSESTTSNITTRSVTDKNFLFLYRTFLWVYNSGSRSSMSETSLRDIKQMLWRKTWYKVFLV